MSSTILQCLQNTFGEIPQMIIKEMKYFTYDEDSEEFFCKICDKVIKKNCPTTLESHLKSRTHIQKSCPSEKVTQALTYTFQGKIPQIIKHNIIVMGLIEEGYECVLCDKTLIAHTDQAICVNAFSYHLISMGHERKLEMFENQLKILNDVYGYIPEVVHNNKQFLQLDKSGKNFVCALCNVLLKVRRNNLERTRNEFEEHFFSSKHMWNAKRSKVLSLIPELKNNNIMIHSYLTRNIDYIIINGVDFFCSLCHENIKQNPYDARETEENLKHHILSPGHEENLFERLNQNNVKQENLSRIIGVFTDEVLKSLRYIEQISDSTFSCSVCNVEFYSEPEYDEFNDGIILHLQSDYHQSFVSEKESRSQTVIESLENVFGKIPESVEENLAHIEFIHLNKFKCTLCDVTFLSKNIERHLTRNTHIILREDKENESDSLNEGLEELLGSDYEDEIPECLNNNWSNVIYENDSGHFRCTLCDETILFDEGNRKDEITLQGLKRHLLSAEHNAKLKEKARKQMKTLETLESIYGSIPKCILNNVHVLCVNDDDSFFCDECDVEIKLGTSVVTTTKNFLQHLRGSLHKSNIENFENRSDDAFNFLVESFGIPECLLKDIEFWDNSGDKDLYCSLCQLELSVDLDDMKQTRLFLECHVDSERHKSNLNDL